MTQPASDPNQTSKMKKLLNGNVNESIKARLPRANGPHGTITKQPALPAATPPTAETSDTRQPRFRFLPAFWTIASLLSIAVNIILIAILLIALQMLGTLQFTANDQASGLLGGLYNNFVKMDQASITTNIHVEKEIPVQFSLNVSGPTTVTLSQDVTINGALVTVGTGGLNIVNARATIVLPQGTNLPINIQNLVVPVDQQVLAVLDVPVNIPLNQNSIT